VGHGAQELHPCIGTRVKPMYTALNAGFILYILFFSAAVYESHYGRAPYIRHVIQWANPKSNPQPQILNLWTSNPKSEKANPKSQITNTQIKSNLQTLNPKSFPNLQKLTYYRRKLNGRLCSSCQKVFIFDKFSIYVTL